MQVQFTNNTAAALVVPVIEESVAAGATVTRNVHQPDWYRGGEHGNPAWLELLDMEKRGSVTVSPTVMAVEAAWVAYLGHHALHENWGTDEINLTGMSGLLATPQTPINHHARHENGGADEMSVAGLSGVLADLQNPVLHAPAHLPAGGDRFQSTGLTLTPAPEVANVINIEVQSPYAAVAQYIAELFPQTLMEIDTATFTLSEAGPGAPVSPQARGVLIFTTDVNGQATLAANDVAGASAETCWLRVSPLFNSGATDVPVAPSDVFITFDAV